MSLYVAGVVGVTGVGAPLAAAIGFVALDNIQAGARSMWTNEHTPTYGGELIEWSGLLPKGYGEIAYSLVDIGLVGKAASVLKTATQTQNVIKLQATKAVKVGQTIKPPEVTISVEKIILNQKNVIELKGLDKPVRNPHLDFPPNTNVVDAMKSEKIQKMVTTDGTDCSEIADKLFEAANGQGKIIEVRPIKQYELNVFENEKIVNGQVYHQIYTDGKYIYDPRLSSSPIPKGDWEKHIKAINPDGIIISDKLLGIKGTK